MAAELKSTTENFARWWANFFRRSRLNAERFLPVRQTTRLMILHSALSIGSFEYASMLLGVSISAFIVSAFAFLLLAVFFQFAASIALVLAVAMAFMAPMVAHHYFAFTVQRRLKEVDVNLLDALRHLVAELRSGVPLSDSVRAIASEDYGRVSELFREAIVLIKEGEEVDEAFRTIAAKTQSLQFQRFVATLSYASASGADIRSALDAYIKELEFSQKNAISLYANEAVRLSTFDVILTGVIPGLLIFMISQGSVISSIRVPIVYLLPLYIIIFPLVKYLVLVRLVKASPGV